jgi:hypothetical protein
MKKEIALKGQLKQYPEIIKDLKGLVKQYSNLVVTRNTIGDAKEARRLFREKRYEIQNVQSSNKSTLNAMKRENNRLADDFINVIVGTEQEIDSKIKHIEEEIEKEREERRRLREEALENQLRLYQELLDMRDELIDCKDMKVINELIIKAEGLKITKKGYGEHYENAIKEKGNFIDRASEAFKVLIDEADIEAERIAAEEKANVEALIERTRLAKESETEVKEHAAEVKEPVILKETVKQEPVKEQTPDVKEQEPIPPNAIDPTEIEKVKIWVALLDEVAIAKPKGFSDYGIRTALDNAERKITEAINILNNAI